jgi:hypothetical protein
MLGSVFGLGVDVGEAEVVGAVAVAVGDGPAVLERDASGLVSPPQPASRIEVASGTSISATEDFVTFPNFTCVSNGDANRTWA